MVILVSLNMKDPNTAGMLRLADAFGVKEVVFQRKPKSFAPAVGTQYHIAWDVVGDVLPLCATWRQQGYQLVGVEQTDQSVLLPEAQLPQQMVLFLGHEVKGLPVKLAQEMDVLVEIPQWGVVPSLNVTSAASIVLYEWAFQHYPQWQTARNAHRLVMGS